MKRTLARLPLLGLAFLIVLVVALLPATAWAQSTIDGDIQDQNGFEHPFQQGTFYAEGLHWVFYEESTDLYCRSSADESSWSAATTIHNGVISDGGDFDVWFDGQYVHVVVFDNPPNTTAYRMGDPESNGSISWLAGWQTIQSGDTLAYNPTVCTDSTGYPWVAYGSDTVTRSTTKNGTWTTDATAGFPLSMDTMKLLPLTSGRMVNFRGAPANKLEARRWDGAAFGATKTTTSNIEVATHTDYVAIDDIVHIVFLEDVSYDIIYTTFDYSTNSFGSQTTLYSGANAYTAPVITKDTLDNLFVAWANYPDADHIYYRRYDRTAAEWGARVDWIDEAILDGIDTQGQRLNMDYDTDGFLKITYVSDIDSLKCKIDNLLEVETLTPTTVTMTTATLRGNIVMLGVGSATTRGFEHRLYGGSTTTVSETGTFATGTFTELVTGLEADSLYETRAVAADAESTEYGDWTSFITSQDSYTGEDADYDSEGYVPPLPAEPGGWIRPPKDWGTIGIGDAQIPYTFLVFLLLIAFVFMVGIAITKHTRHLGLLFLVLGMVIAWFCFWPRGGYLDWWVLLPYILVGWALIVKEQQWGW